MIALADEFFKTKNDPEQLDVNEEVMEQLYGLHPSTITQLEIDDGPVCWILIIPSSTQTMEDFLSGKIGEKEILRQSLEGAELDSLYLCSALVLPEFRNKGIAKRLTHEAIQNIRKSFDIRTLYVWPYSENGKALAALIAKMVSLKIRYREN